MLIFWPILKLEVLIKLVLIKKKRESSWPGLKSFLSRLAGMIETSHFTDSWTRVFRLG